MKASPDRAAGVAEWLLAPGFRGARLLPAEETAGARQGPLEVRRAEALPQDLVLDARSFGAELRRLVRDLRDVTVAEFLVTAITAERDKGSPPPRCATTSSGRERRPGAPSTRARGA